MITLNPTIITATKPISFGRENKYNNNDHIGLRVLDKTHANVVGFTRDLTLTQHADTVQNNNWFDAIVSNFVKAYNILTTPRSSSEQNYNHLPYMA